MASVSAELALEVSRFRSAITRAEKLLDQMASRVRPTGARMGSDLAKGFKAVFLPALAALGVGYGIQGIGQSIVKNVAEGMRQAAEAESLDLAFSTMLGDSKAGDAMVQNIRGMSREFGVSVGTMGDQLRRMIGMGMDDDSAIKLQKSILDVSGMLGLTEENSRLLTMALVQVKSKGVASMEELRQQIAEKGVPIFEALEKKTGLFGAALFKAVEDGKIPAQDVLDIFMNYESSFAKFRGGAEKMAQTTGGAWRVLGAEIADARLEMSEPIADAIRPILRDAIQLVQENRSAFREMGQDVAYVIDLIRAANQELTGPEMVGALGAGLKLAMQDGVNALANGLHNLISWLGSEGTTKAFEENLIASAQAFIQTLARDLPDLLGLLGLQDTSDMISVHVPPEFDAEGRMTKPGEIRRMTASERMAYDKEQILKRSGAANSGEEALARLIEVIKNGGVVFENDAAREEWEKLQTKLTTRMGANRLAEEKLMREGKWDDSVVTSGDFSRASRGASGFNLADRGKGEVVDIGLQGAVEAFFGKSPYEAAVERGNALLTTIAESLGRIEKEDGKPIIVQAQATF